eukprot:CAMPEP_0170476982 /NCGR_PEP_ID=MMETSP0123-20130129/18329_1 /TAXON_ID=182087 /ORGANISM="Favella ehrenbergii, Strain Fehren 1" /LENGTH=111 /DNA_ID=CAMNT_0010748429 /DNA_START=2288 /DNA_END=2623 /DNA_ORIENTATION=+
MATAQMRRATSYSEAQTYSTGEQEGSDDLASMLIGRTSTLNGKHRRRLQAEQAWIKYQIAETTSTAASFKKQRAEAAAKKLLAQGGPHDQEFFHCFKIYLSEALLQVTEQL